MTLALATDATAVTRIEIADHVEAAFDAGAATPADLIDTARTAGARPALLAVLADLPDRPYAELRELWTERPEIPLR